MTRLIRKLIPRWMLRFGWHLPKSIIANIKYGFPARKLRVIGITGTDGKTTTTNMIYQILKAAGYPVSMISTINAEIAGKSYDTGFHVTSPDPEDVQKYLAQAAHAGDKYMVLEVTSHALDQYRVWGINFDIGVITNITHEHLDYHGSFDNYREAKSRLIRHSQVAVLNREDPSYKWLKNRTDGQVVSFGTSKQADWNPTKFSFKLQIPGGYNVANALAAAAVAAEMGVDRNVIKETLEGFTGLSGRMEKIKNTRKVNIVVDFAHTPNALEQALTALRRETKGKLIAVFGCAGARDKSKRPMMGEVAAKLADLVVVTDEDPRYEDRWSIIKQITDGAEKAGGKIGTNVFTEADRTKAIKMAIGLAKPGDTVGIFGKGHEQSMNYQGKELPWSDQKAARQALGHG